MKKSTLTRALYVLAVISFLFACKKDTPQNIDKEPKQENAVLAYIETLGYKESQIKEIGNKYIVDGDIVFYKDRNYGIAKSSSTGKVDNQLGVGQIVSPYQSVVYVRVDPSMSNYASHINAAIAQWNNAGGRLKFYIYNGSGNYDINIVRDDSLHDPNNSNVIVCGVSDYPAYGYAHHEARINIYAIQYNSFDQIQRTICHEIGHAIGLAHTNEYNTPGNQQIPNTPASDNLSLMNGGQCGVGATTLSEYDKVAFRTLYPAPYNISGPAALCTSGNYSVNVPSGASITWSTTGPMNIVGSNTSAIVSVVKTNDTYAYLNATIVTAQGEVYVLTPVGIILGSSSYIPHEDYAVAGESNTTTGTIYTYHMPEFPDAISYSWDVSGGTSAATVYNNNASHPWVDIRFNSPGYHSIFVTVTTPCGQVSLDGQQLEVLVSSGL